MVHLGHPNQSRKKNQSACLTRCLIIIRISSVCKSTYFHLRNIGSILSNDACAQLIHSLVTARLDYCNSILCGLSDNSLYRLPKI